MAGPLYKLWQAKWTTAWYELSHDEQTALIGQVNEALERVGGKRLVLCNVSWSTEQWPVFGIEEFPTLEALQQHSAILTELNWARSVESTTAVGSAWEPAEGRSQQRTGVSGMRMGGYGNRPFTHARQSHGMCSRSGLLIVRRRRRGTQGIGNRLQLIQRGLSQFPAVLRWGVAITLMSQNRHARGDRAQDIVQRE